VVIGNEAAIDRGFGGGNRVPFLAHADAPAVKNDQEYPFVGHYEAPKKRSQESEFKTQNKGKAALF
jgi:hypothetical protein